MYFLGFFIGLFLGSFFNVVALRTLNGENLAFPPSHCVNCNHKLSVLDLFPVISYLFLKGKCRYCNSKISAIYPFGELLTATAYAIILSKLGFSLEALIQLIFVTFLIFATITDLKETIVPNRFIIIGLILVLVLRLIQGELISYYIFSSIISFASLFMILILSRGKMGGADVKLYGLIGLSIGWTNSFGSLFYASIIALILHIPIILNNNVGRNEEIPFVPFITLGVLCTYIVNFFEIL